MVFKEAKLGGKIVSCKVVRNSKNQLSKGYGFVEMDSREAAEKAIKKLQNFMLEDHALKLSLSKKEVAANNAQKKKDQLLEKRKERESNDLAKVEPQNEENKSTKLIVKNLAFEATEAEIKELFKAYGAVKKVRLPKKVNSKSHRGFGFVEFVSQDEAKQAFKNLQHTHLYGRKLIIEWAQGAGQEEEQNQAQQSKVEVHAHYGGAAAANKRQKIN